jgi:tetratricopeptide (TPR) repeat protein
MVSFPRLLRNALNSFRRRPRSSLQFAPDRQAALDSVMEAYRTGDYITALEMAEGLRADGDLTSEYCFYRGSLLVQLGREDEAEKWLRRRLALGSDGKRQALTCSVLGHLMLTQQRYDEAMESFLLSLELWPERASSHRNIAETYLRWGGRPGQALAWARKAVEMERTLQPESDEAEMVHHLNLGEQLATMAWAAAVAGHGRTEVAGLIVEALVLADDQAASAGMVHCQAGHAYAVLGDRAMSEHHFLEAARIDPHGRWGREARDLSAAFGR